MGKGGVLGSSESSIPDKVQDKVQDKGNGLWIWQVKSQGSTKSGCGSTVRQKAIDFRMTWTGNSR